MESVEITFHRRHTSSFHHFPISGPAESINSYSELDGNSSVILPFRNPTDHEVAVDVILKERTMSRSGAKTVQLLYIN